MGTRAWNAARDSLFVAVHGGYRDGQLNQDRLLPPASAQTPTNRSHQLVASAADKHFDVQVAERGKLSAERQARRRRV